MAVHSGSGPSTRPQAESRRTRRVLDHPVAPQSLAESGLSLDLVLQLALKTLHLAGDLSGTELARRMGLRFPVLEPVLAELRDARHIEVSSGSMLGPSSYEYRMLDAGRTRAMLFLQQNQYVGVAPVPLTQYAAYLKAHQAAVPRSAATSCGVSPKARSPITELPPWSRSSTGVKLRSTPQARSSAPST